VPLYWLTTTLKLATILAVPTLASHTRLDPWHTIASYLFISARNSEGFILPLVPVGWTLNYEMFFYAVFALVLFLRKPLLPAITALLALAVAVDLISPVKTTPMAVFDPLILEFCAGAWIARLTLSGVRATNRVSVILLTVGLSVLIATGWLPDETVEHWRLLLWGIPGTLIVFSVVSLEPWFALRRWDLARRLGDASYSIYLSHDFTLLVVGDLAVKAGLHGVTGAAVTFGLGVMASGGIGLAVYRWIELPVTRGLLSWSKSRRASAAVAG
jgi:peptidoglycan/LPS O-acetylase OafA/YrhL